MTVPPAKHMQLLRLFAAISLFASAVGAFAQTVIINQSFTGATLPTSFNYGGNINNNGTITPFLPTASNTSAGMTLTTSAGNESTYAYDPTSFSSANATITAQFTYTASNGTALPADGITFFLADASVVAASGFSPGAFGGSLGYAQKNAGAAPPNGVSGLNGGYLGLGIDQFGNYSNPTEGRSGGPGQYANNVAIRGPGTGQTGYNYLGGTTGGLPNFSAPTSGATATNFEMTISATNQVVMYMEEGGVYTQIFTADLSGYTRPNNLILGFTGSTGGDNSTQQIANVLLTSVPANLWTNVYGLANGTPGSGNWRDTSGSGSTLASNWVNGAVPAGTSGQPADVLLDNTYVNSAQTVDVGGTIGGVNQHQTQIIRALDIDAPFSYTLDSAVGNGTLEFNNEGVVGPSGIFVTQTHGSATQTVNSALVADNAIEIKNGSSGALNLNGTLTNGGNTVTVDGTGTGLTTIAGVVSGTGALVKNDSGSVTLSGANTYSGGTTLNAGTITADNNNALGTGGLTVNGGTLSSDSNKNVDNTITLQGSAKFNNITTSGTLTQTGGSYTLTMDSATQTGAVNLSNTNTGQTLTANVDSGSTSTISGVIQNGGTGAGSLTKAGAGTLILSGADTYTGTTTINAGTLQLGASNVLATTSNVNIAGGNLNLHNNSNKVNNLTFSNGGTLDFGSGSVSNSFVFNSLTPAPTGILTINNYNGPDSTDFAGTGFTNGGDFLGTETNNISAATLNQIYFSGYGTGSLENDNNLTNAGNGLGTAYRIAPKGINWTAAGYVWTENGTGTQNWSGNGGFWNGNATPPNAANPTNVYVDFGTGTSATVNFDNSSTINALRFDPNAPVSYVITDAGNHTLTLNNGGVGNLTFIQQQSSHNQTLSPKNILLDGNVVFDVTGTGSLTVGSAIGDGGSGYSLTKTGNGGTLILSGASTYTGGTSIQTGTVQIQNSTALGTGAVAVSNGTTLQLANGITVANAIAAAGTGTGNNGAIENVSGANTVSGALTLGGNTRINSDAGTLTLSGGITGSGNNLNFGGAGSTTVSSAITTGTGTVTIDGTGTTTFSGAANTYTGDTDVNSGTLTLAKAANTTAIAGNLNINGGTVNENASGQISGTSNVALTSGAFNLGNNATQSFTQFNSSSGTTATLNTGSALTINSSVANNLNGVIAGAGALVTSGTGVVTLAGNNTYSGGTTMTSIVTALNNNSLGTGAVTINSGGKLQVENGDTAMANNFTLNSTGTGANDGAIENLSGATSTISGTVTLTGTSRVQSDNGNLSFTNTVGLGANTLDVGGNSNTSISGVISGTGGLTKDGSGTVTLSGADTFTGTTTISAGTASLNNAAFGTAARTYSIASGATMQLTGAVSEASGTTTISGAGTFSLASGASLNNTTGTGYNLAMDMSSGGSINIASGATLTNGGWQNINWTNNQASMTVNGTMDVWDGNNVVVDALNGSGTIDRTINDANPTPNIEVGVANGSGTFSGVIQNTDGAISLTKVGTGTQTLSGANTYTGATSVTGGTLAAGAANVISKSSSVTIGSGATLALNNFNQTVNNLTNNGVIDFGSGSTAPTLTLTGTNALGGTLANATGTLLIGTGSTLTLDANFIDPNLNIVLAGGTLNLNGTNDKFGSLSITGSGTSTLDFDATGNSVVDFSNLSLQSTSKLSVTNWNNAQDYFYATTFTGGVPNATGATPENQITFTGFSKNATKWFSYDDGPDNDHQIAPVPEPATYGEIFVGACLGLFLLRRLPRRKLAVVKV